MAGTTKQSGSGGAGDDDDREKRLADQAQRIKTIRAKTGLSQDRFARRLGLHGNSVYLWESGQFEITPANAAAISRVYNIPLSDVLGYELPAAEVPVSVRLDEIEAALTGLATDKTVQDCFTKVSLRIDELRRGVKGDKGANLSALHAAMADQAREIRRLLLAVGELQQSIDDLNRQRPEDERRSQGGPG